MSRFRFFTLGAAVAAAMAGVSCTSSGGASSGDAGIGTGADDCPMNSGWPCTCDGSSATCEDGSDCLEILGLDNGPYCAASCPGQGGTCPATEYAAEVTCAITDQAGSSFWCILVCTSSDQCPTDQTCAAMGQSVSVCLP
jgi:hypothetical protein